MSLLFDSPNLTGGHVVPDNVSTFAAPNQLVEETGPAFNPASEISDRVRRKALVNIPPRHAPAHVVIANGVLTPAAFATQDLERESIELRSRHHHLARRARRKRNLRLFVASLLIGAAVLTAGLQRV